MEDTTRTDQKESSSAVNGNSSTSDDDEKEAPPPALVVSYEALDTFADDVNYLWCSAAGSQIPVLDAPPSSLVFLRDHVAVSRPCIIRNAITAPLDDDGKNEQAQAKQPLTLSLDELVDAADPTLELTVDVTPDGLGDCLRMVKEARECDNDAPSTSTGASAAIQPMFVKPQEREMTFSEFRSHLRASQRHGWTKAVNGSGGDNDLSSIRYRLFSTTTRSSPESSTSDEELQQQQQHDATVSDNVDDDSTAVYYYSRQNDCLRTELGSLWEQYQDVFPRGFSWAAQAFGESDSATDATEMQQPDAVNLWIGNERAVSAMHKDHYENLFYVLEGEKVFTLCPPSDAPFLYQGEYPSGTFSRRTAADDTGNQEWRVTVDYEEQATRNDTGNTLTPSTVHWIAANVMEDRVHNSSSSEGQSRSSRFPLLRYAHPMQLRVQAGEMLYLPSLWHHQVAQTCETVAVNYWYDMKFDSPLWCYFHLLQQLEVPTTSTTTDRITNDNENQEEESVAPLSDK